MAPAVAELPPLPSLADLCKTSAASEGWLPIPGMFGGFAYHLSVLESVPRLLVGSWSRITAGSMQRHEVTEQGSTLLDQSDEAADMGVVVPRATASQSNLVPSIACWNINNRIGRTKFKPLAAQGAMALDADVIVLNEFYPGSASTQFFDELRSGGWSHQVMSPASVLIANRVLIASRIPVEELSLPPSTVNDHLSANSAAVVLPGGTILVGLRVPTYKGAELARAWDWVESLAARLSKAPATRAVIVGDFNTSMQSSGGRRMPQFYRMLSNGWCRADPSGTGSYTPRPDSWHEIDHVLSCGNCQIIGARYVCEVGRFLLAGGPHALSDHSALTFRIASI
jgi:hypothetical protein